MITDEVGDQPVVRVLFSAAWQGNIEIDGLLGNGFEVYLVRRSVDWGKRGFRRLQTYVRDSLQILWWSRSHDMTVVSSAGVETFLVALLWPAIHRRSKGGRRHLVILDPLALRWRKLDPLLGVAMHSVARVICIRRGDIDTFGRRFAVPPSRCKFVPMPVPTLPNPGDAQPRSTTPDRYVYAAGSAHRDWSLLLRAFELIPDHRCILATQTIDPSSTKVPPNVQLLPALTPKDGRAFMARATAVAVTFADTDLACGPTIVLDAYAMGLPVICTDTNACRDYVQHGTTGLLSPPGDAAALAWNIRSLSEDTNRRHAMGQAIAELVQGDLSRDTFLARITAILEELRSY